MKSILSQADKPSKSTLTELTSIWYVEADYTYDVFRSNYKIPTTSQNVQMVAIRTLSGNGKIKIRGTEFLELSKDTLLITPNASIERYFCDMEKLKTSWVFYWYEFTSDKYFLPELNTVHTLNLSEDEEYFDLTLSDSSFKNLVSSSPYSSLIASSDFSALLSRWLSKTSLTDIAANRKIEAAIQYIVENINREITVTELSELSEMPVRTFREAFTRYTKLSPKAFIDYKKFGKARELLLNTNSSINEIALSLGFSNQYYFSRAFKKFYAKSPMKYKKEQ